MTESEQILYNIITNRLEEALTKEVDKIRNKTMTKEDYNSIPVEFCSKATCCSLDIQEDEEGTPYCHECGGLRVSKASIEQWEIYYIEAHGDKFLNMKRNDTTQ